MTREEALTMIVASIAMEELALSHILNAEGEKLQYILGTLPGGAKPCAGPQEILEVNQSVTALLEVVMQNQMLLKGKLERVLGASPPPKPVPCPVCPPPCPPPCEENPRPPLCGHPCPCPKSSIQLALQRDGLLWNQGCRLPWRRRAQRGESIRWSEQEPALIRLAPSGAYAIQYTLNVCSMHPAEEQGTILLRQTPCGAFTDTPPLNFSTKCFEGKPQTLQYTAVLYPQMGGSEAELSLVLGSKKALCVERAVLNIVEL